MELEYTHPQKQSLVLFMTSSYSGLVIQKPQNVIENNKFCLY